MSRDFRTHVDEILYNLKHGIKDSRAPPVIPIWEGDSLSGELRVITTASLEKPEHIRLLAKWRKMHERWFPSQFKVTNEGTKGWLEKAVIENKDRVLFFLVTEKGEPVGHMGFYRFDFENKMCEADNILRGKAKKPGIMTPALKALMTWGLCILGLEGYTLRTFSENERAIALYERCAFVRDREIPLEKKVEAGSVSWAETSDKRKAERFFLVMRYSPWPEKKESYS